jgi:hypothetical protein
MMINGTWYYPFDSMLLSLMGASLKAKMDLLFRMTHSATRVLSRPACHDIAKELSAFVVPVQRQSSA